MRLVSLAVENFRAIERAEIAFGRGLNVLYGPNELGKSTLAEAVRALLLLPPNSTHAESYRSWGQGERPRVELVLQAGDDFFYRAEKAFGTTRAELTESKDGVHWQQLAAGRQVDEKLRELLSWGLPMPGGRGGKKGMPASYLVTLMLAPQEDPAALLALDLATDPEQSGRNRLTSALQAISEDERFKRVLERATAKVDEAFSANQRREKRSEDNPLVRIRNQILGLDERLKEARQVADHCARLRFDAQTAERRVEAAGAAEAKARERLETLAARVHRRADLLRQYQAAVTDHEAATAAQDAVTAAAVRLQAFTDELTVLHTRRQQSAQIATRARAEVEQAEERLRASQAADTLAKVELQRQRHKETVARAQSEHSQLQRRLDRVDQCARLAVQMETAQADHDHLAAQLAQVEKTRNKAAAEVTACQERRRQLEAVITRHDCRDAATHLAALETTWNRRRERREQQRQLQETLARNEADALLAQAPDRETFERLQELRRELAAAEQATAVGLAMEVAPRKPIPVQVGVDGQRRKPQRLSAPETFTAERELTIDVGQARLRIAAGSAQARERLTALRQRWHEEAEPVLHRAGADGFETLVDVYERACELRRDIDKTRRDLRQAGDELELLQVDEDRLEDARERYARLQAALDEHGANVGEPEATRPGREDAVREQQRLANEGEAAAGRQADSERQAAVLRSRIEDKSKALAEGTTRLQAIEDELGGPWARMEEQLRAAAREKTELIEKTRDELARLDEQGRGATDAAQRELDEARARHARAGADQQALDCAIRDLEQRRAACRKEVEMLSEAAARHDRVAIERDCAGLNKQLEDLGEADEAQVAAAREALQTKAEEKRTAREEVAGLHAKLGEYGDDVVQQRLARIADALAMKQHEETQTRLEYLAWKKLEQVLQEVQAEQATHLGAQLAEPVGRRFRELTAQGRYGDLLLGPNLELEGVRSAGEARLVGELSVGAREQLATVLRLVIAEHLGTPLMLDDQLVHTDEGRLRQLRGHLREAAAKTQIIVWTCRPHDYLAAEELPDGSGDRRQRGRVCAIDLSRLVQ